MVHTVDTSRPPGKSLSGKKPNGVMEGKNMEPQVTLLVKGEHCHDHLTLLQGIRMLVDPATSSCTLVRGETITVVDTGTPPYAGVILDGLSAQGVSPGDIEYLLLTHSHQDHWRNSGLFPNAKLVIERGNILVIGARSEIWKETVTHPDWTIFDTSGHTTPHYSVRVNGIWNGERQRIVIAGDAIREDLVYEGYYTSNLAKPGELESARRVLTDVDVVIPGHYDVMQVEKIGELRQLLGALS